MQITQAERHAILRASANALSFFQKGEDPEDVLSQIYCHNMEDDSPRQGALMAKELLTWMARFQSGFDAAMEDPEGYAYNELRNALTGMPEEQQITLLQEWIQAVERMNSLEHMDDLETALVAQKKCPICQSKVSQFQPETLLKLLISRIKAVPRVMETIANAAVPWKFRDRIIVERKCGRNMDLAVTAMVIYTMAKNGQLSGFPQDITLSQVALGVCTADLQHEIIMQHAGEQEKEAEFLALKITFVVLMAVAAALIVGGAVWNTALAFGGYILFWLTIVMAAYFSQVSKISENCDDEIDPLPLKLQTFLYPLPEVRSDTIKQKHSPQYQELEECNTEEDDDFQPLGY